MMYELQNIESVKHAMKSFPKTNFIKTESEEEKHTLGRAAHLAIERNKTKEREEKSLL